MPNQGAVYVEWCRYQSRGIYGSLTCPVCLRPVFLLLALNTTVLVGYTRRMFRTGRRIATESFVPLLFKRRRESGHLGLDANEKVSAEIERVFAQSPEAKAASAASTTTTLISSVHPTPTGTLHGTSGGGPIDGYEHARRRIIASSERAMPPYSSNEVFSDYLEMGAHNLRWHHKRDKSQAFYYTVLYAVLQFGYVALWSDYFPLAPLFSIFHNLIEVRSDAFKVG